MDESVCDVWVLSDLKVISKISSTPYTSAGAVVTALVPSVVALKKVYSACPSTKSIFVSASSQ